MSFEKSSEKYLNNDFNGSSFNLRLEDWKRSSIFILSDTSCHNLVPKLVKVQTQNEPHTYFIPLNVYYVLTETSGALS